MTRDQASNIKQARLIFRELQSSSDSLKAADQAGVLGWVLLGYAKQQVELLAIRLRQLGVDTSLGLDQAFLLPGARPPAGDEQMMTLKIAVFEARRWRAIHYSGVRAYHIAIGEETLAAIVAAHCRRVPPIPPEAVGALVDKIGAYILENMLVTFERCLVFEAGVGMEQMPTKKLREVALDILTGWARSNIRRTGNVGSRLRQALEQTIVKDGLPLDQEELLMRELPRVVSLAWHDMEFKEPLRSTGDRRINLARRIGKLLEEEGGQAAKEPGLLADKPIEEFALDADSFHAASFEAREEAAGQQHDDLVAAAGLSPQQAAVWEGVRSGLSYQEIAAKLDRPLNHVYQQRHNAVKKLKAARKAVGL